MPKLNIFNKNKRRDKTTYLNMQDGEVITSDVNIIKSINARGFDDFTDDELNNEDTNVEIKNGLPVCEPIFDNEIEECEDNTISDMKATIFNILKFICIFGLVAAFGLLCLKTLPKTIENVVDVGTSNQSNIVDNVDKFDNSVNIVDNVVENTNTKKVKKQLQSSMVYMNSINNQLKQSYILIQKYCLAYSNNTNTLYAHEKNIGELENAISTDFINLLNTETNFVEDFDKELFEIYKNRYQNLSDCISMLQDTENYNRNSIIEELNKFILLDNEYNNEEFDILIEYFNKYNLSYSITENAIILND